MHQMNIELIIKLTKLANNNPNENEANAAARKVCKLIAEANYQFAIPKVTIVSNPPSNSSDWIKQATAANARAEQAKREHYEQEARKARVDFDLNDLFDFMKNTVRNPNFTGDPYKAPWVNPPNPEAQQKPKVSIKCNKCGKFVETYSDADPSQFRCSSCLWQEWQSKRGVSYDTETKG